MNGREKYFKIINFHCDRIAQWLEAALFFAGGSWDAWQLSVFFFFHRFFTLWLFTFYSHC